MPPTDHNGEDFHYIVSYKRYGSDDEVKQKVMDIRTADSTRREYVVEGQEMYQEYEISVQAGNQEGLAPAQTVERKIGYSGQGGESWSCNYQQYWRNIVSTQLPKSLSKLFLR